MGFSEVLFNFWAAGWIWKINSFMSRLKITLATLLSLIAFAGNSVLCRVALGDAAIDAASFTLIRLFSGAVVLFLILNLASDIDGKDKSVSGSWYAAFMLFLYAVSFSYAYVFLNTASGALILFASVQITIVLASIFFGRRLSAMEWGGLAIAFAGFIYLMLPGATTPSFVGLVLMVISGVAWGVYTLLGKGSTSPLTDTAYNFIRTVPMCIILLGVVLMQNHWTTEGVILAVVSGGLASGIGYSIWYVALGGLTSIQAAVVQLLVPVIAALGGVFFIGEALSFQLLISALVILCGVALVVFG